MNELALFAGAGGGILGGLLHGWRTVAAVEIEDYPRRVLLQRQADGILPKFPIWDDVRTFEGKPWRGKVDVISGGFPCQDISVAGKGAGLSGKRSGLWAEFSRIIGEVRPQFVFVENSPMLVRRGLDAVLSDLAAMGYDAEWGVIGADDAIWNLGDPAVDHERKRIWLIGARSDADLQHGIWRTEPQQSASVGRAAWNKPAWSCDAPIGTRPHTDSLRKLQPKGVEQKQRRRSGNLLQESSDADCPRRKEQRCNIPDVKKHETAQRRGWWAVEPDLGRVAYRVAHRVDRLKAIGNGQVPAVAALAFEILSKNI